MPVFAVDPGHPDQPSSCPLTAVFSLLSGPWTCLIIWHLSQHESLRFLELKRQVGAISAKILTERLRMLEEAGIVLRKATPSSPPQVSYRLSPRGQELRTAFTALHDLALQWGVTDVKKSRGGKPRKGGQSHQGEEDITAAAE